MPGNSKTGELWRFRSEREKKSGTRRLQAALPQRINQFLDEYDGLHPVGVLAREGEPLP